MSDSLRLTSTTNQNIFNPKIIGEEVSPSVNPFTSLTSSINKKSVLLGAGKPWDSERLKNGKFSQFQQIGGRPLTIHTSYGDKVSAFDFKVKNFHEALTKLGGQHAQLELNMQHPFFDGFETVKISFGKQEIPALRIPYDPKLETEFKNPQAFLDFAKRMNYELIWEDTLEPFQTTTGFSSWFKNSRKQNLILVRQTDMKKLKPEKKEKLSITSTEKEESIRFFPFFSKEPLKTRAIIFPSNNHKLFELFSMTTKGLKVESSTWDLMKIPGYVLFLESNDFTDILARAEERQVDRLPIFQIITAPISRLNLSEDRGTVVLMMNQSNSFASYSHEILTFLFAGINVVAYDDPGKGLSQGKCAEENLTEAARAIGKYLLNHQKIRQNQILFKGQCFGGLVASEASKIFPASHVWVDQSPQNFPGAAEKWLENSKKAPTFLTSFLSGIISPILPSYDVVENLKHNHGLQIYTIGVPDEKGNGGDQLVPILHRDKIETWVRRYPMGSYLTIKGGTHVTDWWIDPQVNKSAHEVLRKASLAKPVFPEAPKNAQEALERRFELFYKKKYNPKTSTTNESHVYQLLKAVKQNNFKTIEHYAHWCDSASPMSSLGLKDALSKGQWNSLMNHAISLSRELGHTKLAQEILLARKHGKL